MMTKQNSVTDLLFCFILTLQFAKITQGKLVLNYWPKEDTLDTVFVTGKTLLICDVESDHPFTLKWYKDGKEVNLATASVPLWGYKFKDNTGAAFWHWPYHPDFLSAATEYECRVSNGVDTPVKKKIKYTPLLANQLPTGFPKKLATPSQTKYDQVYYGSNLTFHCNAQGDNLQYRWFHNRVPLEKLSTREGGDIKLSYKISNEGKRLDIYNLPKIQSSLVIVCMVANSIGLLLGPEFFISAVPKPTPTLPPMVPKVIAYPTNVSVGGPEQWVEFDCKAIGHPKPLYWWWHDGEIVTAGADTGKLSVVAMRSGNLTCQPWNKHGSVKVTAYLFVKPLPYRAKRVEISGKDTNSITIRIMPNFREEEWHPHIPITEAIIHHRPYVFNQPEETAYQTKRIKVTGSAPWYKKFDGLEPWKFIDFRIQLVNKYGTGNVSEWFHGATDWGTITEPVRNLKATPLSAKSFKVEWQNPTKTNGPLTRYEFYYTTRPDAELKYWIMKGVDPTIQLVTVDWTYDRRFTEIAPVLYWKVRLIGFVNKGPFSETKAFKCLPGAPGFVTGIKVKVMSPRSIQITWLAANNSGSGIIGHDLLYNRGDKPVIERLWKIHSVNDPHLFNVTIGNLLPNRPYEFKIYARSKETRGVPSKIVKTRTVEDAPSAPPQNVRGIAKHSQTLLISWDPPPLDHQNSPITGYTLYYSLHGREPNQKKMESGQRQIQLQGLGKYKKYALWMVAHNRMGKSPPSPEYEIVTKEEVPEGAPRSVQAQALNETTIGVTWKSPKSVLQNGRITGYKISYSEWENCKGDDSFEKVFEVVVSGSGATDAVIRKELYPATSYKLRVSALTSVGAGTNSNPMCISTPVKRPTAPQMTVTLDKTDNVVTLKWRLSPGPVTGYTIKYGKTLNKFDSLINVKTKRVSADVRLSAFDDLDPGVFYAFKLYGVLAENRGLTAPNTHWLKTSDGLPRGPPLFFTAITQSASSIKLKWEEPDAWLRSGKIVGYEILYKRDKQDVDWSRKRYELRGEEDQVVYLLQDLKSNTNYIIMIKARTVVGAGKATEELVARTNREILPVVRLLRVEEVDAFNALLRWDRPENADKFKEYTFKYMINLVSDRTYRTSGGTVERTTSNKTFPAHMTTDYYLDRLIPGTKYEIKVRVDLQDAGIGDPVPVSFTTKSEKPQIVVTPSFQVPKEMGKHIPLNIPAVSEKFGPVNHCYLFVVVLDSPLLPNYLRTSLFLHNTGQPSSIAKKRRRRSDVTNDNDNDDDGDQGQPQLPDSYIAGFFKNDDLPTVFKLGNGSQHGNVVNQPLIDGKYYTTFIRAFVRASEKQSQYLAADSNFSTPLLYAPTDLGTSEPTTGAEGAVGGNTMIIIIAAVASLLFIIVIIVVIVFIRRRKGYGPESDRLLSKKRKGSCDPTDLHRLHSNAPEMLQHPPIPIDLLAQYVEGLRANNGSKLLKEFDSINPERELSEASLLPQNKMKNRYPNVLAYDTTRVKLDHTGILCSDYINANFIDGYCKEKAYISTQGPLKATVDDFWRLCWENNVQSIVMMTRLEERGRSKCEQYWPSGGSEVYGTVKVTIKEEKTYCHFTIRAFEVCSNLTNDTRIVKHFQYLQWPDPGVPLHYGPVLAFIRRVRDFDAPGCGPTVVHCSAGVGRSACYIAIDAMLERLKYDSMIDIYGYVTMMRTQRNFMVQTDEQYIFIFDVLVEAIQHGDTEIASCDLAAVYKNLTEFRTNGREPLIEIQFNSLNAASNYYDQTVFSHAHLPDNEAKNRCRTIVPFDHNRVTLQAIYRQENSEYINASHIDGFYKKNAFIATQAPLENTTADFWRMVMEQNASTIVMLSSDEEDGKDTCAQYWPSTKTLRHYYYVIDPVQEKRFANFSVREFKVTDARDSTSREIRLYHYHTWNASSAPTSSEGILELIGQVQKAQTKSESNGPIIVHGSTGAGRTGVFIALSIALESLRSERIVDIYQIVKTLRHERPYMVQTLEQFEFCYRVTSDFLKNFDFVV